MNLDELLKTGDSCINEEPPACTAHCPVHLDVKSFIEEIEKGDFNKAYKIMEKRIPFARIIGMICDHPCEDVCVRNSKGGAIGIGELEKSAVYYGYSQPKKTRFLLSPKKTISVIGAGIRGMTAAFDLYKKGYKIDIYEKSSRPGGRLWTYAGETLTEDAINEEFDFLNHNNIKLYLNTEIDLSSIEEIIDKYDAVLLSSRDLVNQYKCDSLTFQVDDSKIFSAFNDKGSSIIFAVSAGKRAAISIDRYLQNVSIKASRENEGSYETVLKYKTKDEKEKKGADKKASIYSQEEAAQEAARCFKCQCRDCINPCVHLKRFNTAPKSYIRNINHNERIINGNHYANKMINSCTECGLCNEMCDYGVNMKEVIKETRESMVMRGKMPQSVHDFALKDMKFSNSRRFLTYRKQRNKDKVKYVFYPGCQLPASDPDYIERIYSYLTDNINEGTGLMLGCCGAPADWAGQNSLMKESTELIKNAWEELGRPIFILACSSCAANFEKYLKEIECVSLWEVIDKNPMPKELPDANSELTVNIHDPCSSRHNEKAQKSVRNILSKLNYKVSELKFSKDKTKCCGYGGLVYFANRDQAEDLIDDRIDESPEDLLVYCTMCKDLFISHGKRTFHILDLLFSNNLEEAGMRKMPTLSQRQENRMMVKKKLLNNIWGENLEMDKDEKYNITLTLTDTVKEKMEELYILLSDIKKAVANSIETKERFFNREENSYLARLRIENVTYWVKYEIKDEKIIVANVYSHRMEVVEAADEKK